MLGGRYRLEQQIGRGGTSVVYRAFDERLRRVVAVKVVAAGAGDSAFQERFQREAQTVAALSHPAIATVYDAGQEDGQQYLVMEYLPWPTLRQVMASGPRMPVSRIITLALRLADALAAAHRHGLVHCDVKPDNVLAGPDDQVKLVDFGIAQTGTDTGMWNRQELWGTAAYLTPEQVEGGRVDERTDVYALGLVLYELTAGELPFSGRTPGEVALARLTQSPTPLAASAAPEDGPLRAVVDRCLRRTPAERFQSMGELTVALQAALRALPQSTPSSGAAVAASAAVALHEAPTVRIERPPVGPPAIPRKRSTAYVFLPILAVVMLGGLWLLGTRGAGVLPRLASPSSTATPEPKLEIPDLIGLTSDQAQARLKTLHLTPRYAAPQHSEQIPSGAIMAQEPSPLALVRAGTTITLTVSLGPPRVTVPNVIGRSREEAANLLAQRRLQVGEVTTKQDLSEPGSVLEQSPVPGQSATVGSRVDLVVSSGAPVQVPRVIGMRRDDAERSLRAAHLVVGQIHTLSWLSPLKPLRGMVMVQSPLPTQTVLTGSRVDLWVSE